MVAWLGAALELIPWCGSRLRTVARAPESPLQAPKPTVQRPRSSRSSTWLGTCPGEKTSLLTLSRRCGENAQLHHQSKRIHDDACFLYTAFLEPVDDDAPNPDLTPCRGYSQELPLMRSRPLKAASYFVAFRNLLRDRKVQIRERRSHTAKNVLQTFQSRALTGKWNLLNYVIPYKLRSRIYIAPRDNLFRKAPDYDGVFLCAQSVSSTMRPILSFRPTVSCSRAEKKNTRPPRYLARSLHVLGRSL